MKNILIGMAVFTTATLGLVKFGLYTVHQQEQKECATWAKQAAEYPKFYYTEWQKVQCKIN